MLRRTSIALALLLPVGLAAQSSQMHAGPETVMYAFITGADLFGGRLVAAFESIPADKYDYRPTPPEQSVGFIAQHLERANYGLCERFADLKHTWTAKDSLSESVKAAWPKDTLVARLRASLRFCDDALERVGRLESGALASPLLGFETDLAEHYSQLSVYMRLLGLVPPSAIPPKPRIAIGLPVARLSPLVGLYRLPYGLEFEVAISEGMLFIRSTFGSEVRLWPETPNDFFVKEVDAQVTFVRDATGSVNAFVLHQYGRDRRATKIR